MILPGPRREVARGVPRAQGVLSRRLSGPLDRLNAILSLLQPLNRYRAPSAIGSAIGRPLSCPISHPRTGGSPQLPRSKPLRGAQPRDRWRYSVSNPFKTSAKRKRDRGRDSQPRPRPRLKSQPQGATKRDVSRHSKRQLRQEFNSETSKRHLKRQQPQNDAKSDAKFAALVQFLTCHFTVVAFRGRCTILQKSSFHGC